MTKLGELLKSEREKRGLSLHEIGMSLKINPKILKAIEDGDQPNLPAKTFLRGFVKSYAQFLRLDLDQTLQMFQEEYGATAPKVVMEESQPSANPSVAHPTHAPGPRHENTLKRPDSSALPVSSSNRVYTIVIALVLLTLIAFVAKMMDKYQKESRISESDIATVEGTVESVSTTTLPVSGQALSTPVDPSVSTSTTLPSGTTTTLVAGTGGTESTSTTTTLRSAVVAPTGTPTTTSTSTTLRAATVTTIAPTTTTLRPAAVTTTTLRPAVSATAAPTTTTLRPGAVTTAAPTTTTLRPGTVTTAAPTTTTLRPGTATTPPPTTTTLKPAPAAGVAPATTATTATSVSSTTLTTVKPPMTEVIVEALNRVSIRFTLNAGQSWESLTLNPDQVHTFRSRTNVQLEFTDGGAVNVIVNGRDRGVPGTIGKPIKLTYP